MSIPVKHFLLSKPSFRRPLEHELYQMMQAGYRVVMEANPNSPIFHLVVSKGRESEDINMSMREFYKSAVNDDPNFLLYELRLLQKKIERRLEIDTPEFRGYKQ